jgi:hypothetical protein
MKRCQQCQRIIEPKRSTMRFCSSICRSDAHRGLPADVPTEDELLDLDVEYEMDKRDRGSSRAT